MPFITVYLFILIWLIVCFFMICVFHDSFDTAKYYSTSKSRAMGCELAMGRAHSFMLILGRVGLGHFICGSSLVDMWAVVRVDFRPAGFVCSVQFVSVIFAVDEDDEHA